MHSLLFLVKFPACDILYTLVLTHKYIYWGNYSYIGEKPPLYKKAL